jgi:hypothetical protein
MKYEILKSYSGEEFRRITGVKRVIFGKMLKILPGDFVLKHAKGDRRSKLPLEGKVHWYREKFLGGLFSWWCIMWVCREEMFLNYFRYLYY